LCILIVDKSGAVEILSELRVRFSLTFGCIGTFNGV
jgi:hypothetical protein